MLTPSEEVEVGDVFADLRATVVHTEPLSDMLWILECMLDGTGGQTVTLVLPRGHNINVYRL